MTSPLLTQAVPQVLGRRIAFRPSDSLHAVPWTAGQDPVTGELPGNQISLWHTGAFGQADGFDIRPLDWPGNFTQPETAFVGDRIVIADAPGGAGPVQVREYDSSTLAQVGQFQYGDANSRIGCGCQTSTGGAIFINFVTFGVGAPQYGFDIAYRPISPPAPHIVTPWLTKRILLPNADPGAVFSPMDVVEVGGVVYLFHGFDGSGRWDLLTINLADLSYEHTVNFIGRESGDIAPCIEIPYITATLDKPQNRILLAYQHNVQVQTGCPGGSEVLAYACKFVAMDLATRVCTLIKILSWDAFHMLSWCPVPLWSKTGDGIYFPSVKRAGCEHSLAFYRLEPSGTVVQLTPDIPGGIPYAISNDGWVTYKDPAATPPFVTALAPLGTTLKIENLPAGYVAVSWDFARDTDVLEASTDLKTWQVLASGPFASGAMPVVIPKTRVYQFYRVRSVR